MPRSSFDRCLDKDELKQLRAFHRGEGRTRIDDRASVEIVNGCPVLVSYWTKVARVEGGKLVRMWDGWSATTAKHITEFCRMYSLDAPNKKIWERMEIR